MNVEIVCERVWSEQTPHWTSSAHTSWIFPFRAFYMYFKMNIQTKEKLVFFLFHSMGERFGGVWWPELWSFLWWPFVVSIKRKFLSSLAVVGSKIHFSWTLWFQFPPLFCWLPLCNVVYFFPFFLRFPPPVISQLFFPGFLLCLSVLTKKVLFSHLRKHEYNFSRGRTPPGKFLPPPPHLPPNATLSYNYVPRY